MTIAKPPPPTLPHPETRLSLCNREAFRSVQPWLLRPPPPYLTGCVTFKYLIPEHEEKGKRGSQKPSLCEGTAEPSPRGGLLCRKCFISQLTKAKGNLSRVCLSLKATGFKPLCPPAIALNEL